jgi:hypothetical protein
LWMRELIMKVSLLGVRMSLRYVMTCDLPRLRMLVSSVYVKHLAFWKLASSTWMSCAYRGYSHSRPGEHETIVEASFQSVFIG